MGNRVAYLYAASTKAAQSISLSLRSLPAQLPAPDFLDTISIHSSNEGDHSTLEIGNVLPGTTSSPPLPNDVAMEAAETFEVDSTLENPWEGDRLRAYKFL